MNATLRIPRCNALAWILTLGGVWLWTWRYLSFEWSLDPQYQYGFAVPFLFLFVAWQRWEVGENFVKADWKFVVAAAAAWGLFFLSELLRRHDPVWHLTAGTMMLSVTILTILWLRRCGGARLVRRMIFPLVFAWCAVPWPVRIDLEVTQFLQRMVTGVLVQFLNICGIAALQRGNLVELSNGMLGIEAACSGLQSLQAALMAALFLGELYRLPWLRRLFLLAGGMAIAIFMNFSRILFLACVVQFRGMKAESSYHDPAGWVATLLTFLILALLALKLPGSGSHRTGAAVLRHGSFDLTGRDGFVVLGLFGCVPALAWFSLESAGRERMEMSASPVWSLHTGTVAAQWHADAIEPNAGELTMLQYSEREGVHLASPSEKEAIILHFFWAPGRRMPAAAFCHTPAVCMSSAGWELVDKPVPIILSLRGNPFPCVKYRFRQDGAGQVVYQSLCIGGRPTAFVLDPNSNANLLARLSTLWRAPAEEVNEVILIYLPQTDNEESQNRVAEEMLKQAVTP